MRFLGGDEGKGFAHSRQHFVCREQLFVDVQRLAALFVRIAIVGNGRLRTEAVRPRDALHHPRAGWSRAKPGRFARLDR
jgi:hypothetical protein